MTTPTPHDTPALIAEARGRASAKRASAYGANAAHSAQAKSDADLLSRLATALENAKAEAVNERDTESYEILSDLVSLRDEFDVLNGGGPGYQQRWDKALSRAREFTFQEPCDEY